MLDSTKNRLKEAGIDVEGALARFMGNDALMARFMGKFANDASYAALKAAFEAGDADAGLTASHTLKGVCGNLSMSVLFDLLTKQVAAFRAGDAQGAWAMMPEIDAAYEKTLAAIQQGLE